MIQIIGSLSSSDTRKAIRFCKERRIENQVVDIKERALSKKELDNIFDHYSPSECIDKNSRKYKEKLSYMTFDAREEIEEDQSILVQPILRCKGKVALGYDEEFLKENGK